MGKTKNTPELRVLRVSISTALFPAGLWRVEADNPHAAQVVAAKIARWVDDLAPESEPTPELVEDQELEGETNE